MLGGPSCHIIREGTTTWGPLPEESRKGKENVRDMDDQSRGANKHVSNRNWRRRENDSGEKEIPDELIGRISPRIKDSTNKKLKLKTLILKGFIEGQTEKKEPPPRAFIA